MRVIFFILIGMSSLIFAEFTREPSGVVTDSETQLEWQDDTLGNSMTWNEAINHCEGMSLDGGGWRLPNINEFISILDDTVYNPSISSTFQKVTTSYTGYWSSTDFVGITDSAWFVRFFRGYQGTQDKSDSSFVRCVRSGHIDSCRLIQGETICGPSVIIPDSGTFLPEPCTGERLIQGTDQCNPAETVPDLGTYLSFECSAGFMPVQGQGVEGCVENPGCVDSDGDGYYAQANCGTTVDCDDDDFFVNSGIPESCNGKDDNCDGKVDEVENLNPPLCDKQEGVCSDSVMLCGGVAGWLPCNYSSIPDYENPEATCDGLDNDCDGEVDTDASNQLIFYRDSDGDGYGDAQNTVSSCTAPAGYVNNSSDCNDMVSTTYPGATEVCDGVDNDCDALVDEDGVCI